MGAWIEKAKGQIARWRERVRTWLYQHPRVVHVLGVVWLLYVLLVIGMLAGAILLHHWFHMGLWGFLTLKAVAPLWRLLFLPIVPSDQEQPERWEPLLLLTAADQAAVQEIYQQRRRKR